MTTFNYAARDYDTIKSDLLARASRLMPEWTDRDPSDFGMLLVDLWAYMGDVQHYYIDRAAQEAFLATATQRESVLAIANLLDYRPVGRASASGTVTVENTNATAYVVPQYTEFTARYNDKTYTVYAKQAATIPATSSAQVTVGEGAVVEVCFWTVQSEVHRREREVRSLDSSRLRLRGWHQRPGVHVGQQPR